MDRASQKLKALLIRRVKASGLSWNSLNDSASQIVVFGSHALAVQKRTSDLDVLCIGNGERYKSDKLHLIWVPQWRTHSKRWLNSELATHIAAYGKWVKGCNDWAQQTKPDHDTLERKKRNIIARLGALQRHWDDLLPKFQHRQIAKLRRDLQRYKMMHLGKPTVPKPLLESAWNRINPAKRWDLLLVHNCDVAGPVREFLKSRTASKTATSRTPAIPFENRS